MDDQNKDKKPTLARNVELQMFAAQSTSLSIPINSSYGSNGTFISHTGPLNMQRTDECTIVSGALFDNSNSEIVPLHENQNETQNNVEKQKHITNDPVCVSCPAACKHVTNHYDGPSFLHNKMTKKSLSKLWLHFPVKYPHSKGVQRWNKFFAISCLVAIFIDPLFFFVLTVSKEHKCIVLNSSFLITIATVRSIVDFIYLLHIILQFRLAYVAPESRVVGTGDLVVKPRKIAWNYFSGYFARDLFILLPLPQVMILVIIPRNFGASSANFAKNLLCASILLQYFPRISRVIPLLGGQSASGFIFESAWANFIINLLIFVLAGHVVGSCWYLFGLQRVNRCLSNACRESGIPNCESYRDCGPGNVIPGSDVWINNANATSCLSMDGDFDYGIYQKAVNLTTKRSIVTRYIYSLFWGFQQISTLAGNLTPSYFEWEVLFTMAVVGLGLLLFALLIGNMQNFLLGLGRRRMDMQLRRRDVEKWMSHRRLPGDLRRKVREAERFKWSASQGTDEEELLKNLPEDLQRDIRRHYFQFLKNVNFYESMDEPAQDIIFEKLRQILYIKGNDILCKGAPVDKMVFIVRGEIESIEDGNVTLMPEGAVCGEELLTSYLEQLNKDIGRGDGRHCLRENGNMRFIVSNKTIRCLTNVEGFVLRSKDLEEITSHPYFKLKSGD